MKLEEKLMSFALPIQVETELSKNPPLEKVNIDEQTFWRVGQMLSKLPSPYTDFESFRVKVQRISAALPSALISKLIDFKINPHAPGALLIKNVPVDAFLPDTPAGGGRAVTKKTFVSE